MTARSPQNRSAVASSSIGHGAPWVLLLGSLLLSLVAAYYVAANIQARDRMRLRDSVASSIREVRDGIRSRIDADIALLRGGSGLFAAKPDLSQKEFDDFVERLRLRQSYPGIMRIGFARWIGQPQQEAFVEQMRREGRANFQILPAGVRPQVAVIEFLNPLSSTHSRAMVGFDMWSDPIRREAMTRARDEAMPVATARLTPLKQIKDADQAAGFMIVLPIYRGAIVPATLEQRRANLIGFIYSPVHTGELLRSVTDTNPDSRLEWTVYDGPGTSANEMIYRTGRAGTSKASSETIAELRPITVDVAGRTWTLAFEARPGFAPTGGWTAGGAVLIGGALFSMMLFWLTRSEVSARNAAERSAAALVESKRAVERSEHRFRTLFEQSPLSIQIFTPDGQCVLANHAWEELWQSPLKQTSGYNLRNDPQLKETGIAGQIERAFGGETIALEPICYDPAKNGNTGRPRWVAAQLYPVQDAQGRMMEMVLVHQDITERKVAEEERTRLLNAEREARSQAEEANRTKDEFLATLSHELRTPLNAILGWSQLLRVGGMEGEEFQHALETIERNARVQARLIEDLLDLSRIITGKLKLQAKPVDLPLVIDAAIDSVRPTAAAKGIRLIPVLDSAATPVMGDAHRLQQVAWNLLSNAIKFTPAGGTVEALLTCQGSQAELVVSDTGAGIAPDFLPYVFERLRQADSSSTRRHGGLGLGLAIARHLVELHGGSIGAASPGLGKGATFTVTLPLTDASRLSHGAGKTPAEGAGDGQSLAGVAVLVVDDEPDARELLTKILTQQGASVKTACSAPEAREAVREKMPDILLCDISMPGENGYSLMRHVRSLPGSAGGRIPSIALTALARQEDRREALAAGFQLHLTKPIDPTALTDAVAHLARGAKNRTMKTS